MLPGPVSGADSLRMMGSLRMPRAFRQNFWCAKPPWLRVYLFLQSPSYRSPFPPAAFKLVTPYSVQSIVHRFAAHARLKRYLRAFLATIEVSCSPSLPPNRFSRLKMARERKRQLSIAPLPRLQRCVCLPFFVWFVCVERCYFRLSK